MLVCVAFSAVDKFVINVTATIGKISYSNTGNIGFWIKNDLKTLQGWAMFHVPFWCIVHCMSLIYINKVNKYICLTLHWKDVQVIPVARYLSCNC